MSKILLTKLILVAVLNLGIQEVIAEEIKIIDRIAVVVNSSVITESQLEKIQQEYKNYDRDRLIEELIKEELLLQEITKFITLDEEALIKTLQDKGLDPQTIEIYKKDMLKKKFIEKLMNDISLTTNQIKNIYKNLKYEYKIRYILVNDRKLAEDILSMLNKGSNFEELAKIYSLCPTQGKSIGYLNYYQLAKEIGEILTHANPKELYPRPIKAEAGYYIVEILDRKEIPKEKQHILANNVIESIKQEKLNQKLNSIIESGRKKAFIKIY